jgi:hypothetical protein
MCDGAADTATTDFGALIQLICNQQQVSPAIFVP